MIEGQETPIQFLKRAGVFGNYTFMPYTTGIGEPAFAVWSGDRALGSIKHVEEYPTVLPGGGLRVEKAWIITDWYRGNVRQGYPGVYGRSFKTQKEAADFLRQVRAEENVAENKTKSLLQFWKADLRRHARTTFKNQRTLIMHQVRGGGVETLIEVDNPRDRDERMLVAVTADDFFTDYPIIYGDKSVGWGAPERFSRKFINKVSAWARKHGPGEPN